MGAIPVIWIFNTEGLERQRFQARVPGQVGFYTCGPTVYRYAHIGNFRTYLLSDFWVRALAYFGNRVTHVQNITDVGHLQDDIADRGEDKILAAARAEGKSAAEIAAHYTSAFLEDARLLRIRPADHNPRATEFVPAMIDLVRRLEQLGYAYEADGSVYYDVSRRAGYPRLSANTLEDLRGGHRAPIDPAKRHPADFVLWKTAGGRREQIWDSPWGPGFPGWHLECSAMTLHHFPQGLDVHAGGADLVFPHHEDEIAQSEPLLGARMVNYWVHGGHLLMGGRKMAKSSANVVRVADLAEAGYDPLAFRYLCLETRYRTQMRYSEEALAGANSTLRSLRRRTAALGPGAPVASATGLGLRRRFASALGDDLNLPQVPPLIASVLRAPVPDGEKRSLLEEIDTVLQVGLTEGAPPEAGLEAMPPDVARLVEEREAARREARWADADAVRARLAELGYAVEDGPAGTKVRRL